MDDTSIWRSLCILVVFSVVLAKTPISLFHPKNHIIILDARTLNQTLHNSDTFLLVNFYSSWCGHCHHFAPIYKTLATDIKAWSPVIQLAAIDCAVTENYAECNNYDINGFPTLKFFQPHASPKDRGLYYSRASDSKEIRQDILDHVDSALGEKGLLSAQDVERYSRLLPLRSLEDIWRDVSPSVKHTVIVFEKEDSFVGREVILDFWLHKDIVIRRMLKENVTQYGIKKFPSVYLIERGANFQSLASNGTDREHFATVIKQLLDISDSAKNETMAVRAETLGRGDQLARQARPGVYLQDLMSAVRYSLYAEVSAIHNLDKDKLDAVRNYVRVLAKYLPCRRPARSFLTELDSWLHLAVAPLDSKTWQETLHKLERNDSRLPDNSSYVGCRGSQAVFRGYPCGLWMLFHTLTVNSVIDHGKDREFNPREVLQAMYGFITQIFGCKKCGENFQREVVAMDDKVTRSLDAIIYLWDVHNNVNHRLHGQLSEDPFYPKVQFPTRSLCPSCYRDNSIGEDDRPNFDWDETLKFLMDFYSRREIIGEDLLADIPDLLPGATRESKAGVSDEKDSEQRSSKSRLDDRRKSNPQRREDLERLRAVKREETPGEVDSAPVAAEFDKQKIMRLRLEEESSRYGRRAIGTASGFSSIDLSMCVMFYVLCTILLIVAYFHFTVRRKMKPVFCCNDIV